MRKIIILLSGLLTAFPLMAVSIDVADAADGCGRGRYHNGHRCVPMRGGPGGPYGYNGGPRHYDDGYRGGSRIRPTVGANGQVSCGNPRYTFRDGACRPYQGR
jgi:hypothetical protein